jgi:broad specificity phosphatase PhoE
MIRIMMTRLSLLCHATTTATREYSFPADESLDARALERLTARPHDLGEFDRCWSSPAIRALQTARALRLGPEPDGRLRDCDYGRWRGHSFDDVYGEEPDAVAEWMRDPAASPHDGESHLDLIERVGEWLEAQASGPGKTIAVTHASVIRAVVVQAIGAPPSSFWRIDIAPLTLVRLSGIHGRWNLVSIGPMPTRFA